jgi:hypothetical protein
MLQKGYEYGAKTETKPPKKGEAKITTLEKWLKGNGFIGDPFQTRGQNADWSDRDAQSNL